MMTEMIVALNSRLHMHSILFSYFSKSLKICENYLSIILYYIVFILTMS